MPITYTPLIPIQVASIYNGPLPKRLALCTPDTKAGILAVVADLNSLGFALRLSDLFRSHDAQQEAHMDFVQGRKKAFSPPAGGSMHEAGRAMDIDLASIGVPLPRFWEIASARGFTPIIPTPDPHRSEAWHFDFRGSHDAVYRYAASGKAGAIPAPYAQMAQSGILSIGVAVDIVPAQDAAFLQAGLIRLGADPGRIDGVMGDRTKGALRGIGADANDPFAWMNAKLKAAFPAEYAG